ncbi:hypothetical protein [Dyella sp. S184]|uniref:hypothetical protein n=1 Tax=Dyella sp. S184 TaxID=1641862 RepID=UPI00131CADA7|nr:hypothetical protein [Dyella sp. S184]
MSNEELLKFKLLQKKLVSVTFIKDYLQLNFDGPYFNFYDYPSINVGGEIFDSKKFGYREHICNLIGSKVVLIKEDIDSNISINFDNSSSVSLSLKPEDRSSVEIAMFQSGSGEGWIVW